MSTNPLFYYSIPFIEPQSDFNEWTQHKIQEGGRSFFGKVYFQETRQRHVLPLTCIWNKSLENHGFVLIPADRLKKLEEWEPIAQSLKRVKHSVNGLWIGSSWLDAHRYKLFIGAESHKGNDLSFEGKTMLERMKKMLAKQRLSNVTNEIPWIMMRSSQLVVSNKIWSVTLEAITDAKHLEVLSFSRAEIGDQGLKVIASSIKNSNTLKWVDLSQCQLTDSSVIYIHDILTHQSAILHSDMWKTSLRAVYRVNQKETNLKPLRNEKGIKRLNLSCNHFTDELLSMLLSILEDSLVVEALEVQFNEFSADKIQEIQTFLLNNKHDLIMFDIRNNTGYTLEDYNTLKKHINPSLPAILRWKELDPEDPLAITYWNDKPILNGIKSASNPKLKKIPKVKPVVKAKDIAGKNKIIQLARSQTPKKDTSHKSKSNRTNTFENKLVVRSRFTKIREDSQSDDNLPPLQDRISEINDIKVNSASGFTKDTNLQNVEIFNELFDDCVLKNCFKKLTIDRPIINDPDIIDTLNRGDEGSYKKSSSSTDYNFITAAIEKYTLNKCFT
ncbi:hypothetical protein O9G_000238 [Rozella allomycis CSF55]|uniref:RNI-like protein n=1 Tax=Rozella allomycis (strain CSF55) TaxID=988480 RepID=A0A075AP65_ROZAC|nr:hypothetical protein O9G_000238 [Rozella allomycis CSF55]|eukprot:EPZ31759.1 hypothetical protein O9G_000238 [Rozella allomycis CSF55]